MHLDLSNTFPRLRLALVIVAVFGLSKALSAQTPEVASRVRKIAGCYATHVGRWSGPLPPGLSVVDTPPAQFQLDTVPVSVGSASYVVRPSVHVDAEWTPLPNDSIRMFWSRFTGVTLQLRVRGDSLVGIARTFHDAHHPGEPPDPSAPVIATRVSCPSKRA